MTNLKLIQNEKALRLKKDYNQYCFKVDKDLDKPSIAKIVGLKYNVGVQSVNTSIRIKREKKTLKTRLYKRTYKLAIVSVKAGDTIQFE